MKNDPRQLHLLVFAGYYPPHIGGLESHSDEFNKYLSQKGVDITVFTPRLPSSTAESEIRYNDVHPVKSPTSRGPASQEFNGVKNEIIASFADASVFVKVSDIRPLFKIVADDYLAKKYDKVAVIYTDYISTVVQKTCLQAVRGF